MKRIKSDRVYGQRIRKIYDLKVFKLILTDEDIVFYEDDEAIRLSEETGWWDEEGNIYVYLPGLSKLQKLGIGVHEFVEMFLVRKLGFPRRWAHKLANVLEYLVSLGRADLYWDEEKI